MMRIFKIFAKQNGFITYDHLKKIFIAAGISDWEKILKELSPEKMAQIKQQQAAAMGPGMMPPGMPPQGMMPPGMDPSMMGGQPPKMPPQGPPQGMPPMGPPMQNMPQFEDPAIAQAAAMMLGGAR